MSISNKLNLTLLFTCLLLSTGCEQNDDSQTATIDPSDMEYISFGEVFPVKDYPSLELTNPHEVSAYAIWKCCQGQTEDLLSQVPHVEKDDQFGKALTTYVEMFGPDLEQYRNVSLAIKFEGYRLDDDSSVWYYHLTNPDGICLQHQPWVSSHRSRTTQRCALTGIFLYDPNENIIDPLPDGIVRSFNHN